MEIIAAPRGTGKTTKLVYRLLEDPVAVIVVSTEQRKRSLRPIVEAVMRREGMLHIERDPHSNAVAGGQLSPAQRIDLVMERVLSCDDVNPSSATGYEWRLRNKRVLVDDVEDVLHYWLGADVEIATASVRG